MKHLYLQGEGMAVITLDSDGIRWMALGPVTPEVASEFAKLILTAVGGWEDSITRIKQNPTMDQFTKERLASQLGTAEAFYRLANGVDELTFCQIFEDWDKNTLLVRYVFGEAQMFLERPK